MFITFEGPDGSGKTTALDKLVKWLDKQQNINFVTTREPGSSVSKENKIIREIIVSNDFNISDMAEAILFSADRRLHLERLIWPSLKQNKIVLCDRYFDSTFAYQGAGRGLGIDKMIDFQNFITENTYPDVTFYFDLPVDVALKRVNTRGEKNRLDNESVEFVKRVHEGYHKLISRWPERFVVIDASQSQTKVFEQVKKEFEKRVLRPWQKRLSHFQTQEIMITSLKKTTNYSKDLFKLKEEIKSSVIKDKIEVNDFILDNQWGNKKIDLDWPRIKLLLNDFFTSDKNEDSVQSQIDFFVQKYGFKLFWKSKKTKLRRTNIFVVSMQ